MPSDIAMPPVPVTPRRRLWVMRLVTVVATCILLVIGGELVARIVWQPLWAIPREAFAAPGVFSTRMAANFDGEIRIADGGAFRLTTNSRGFPGPTLADVAGHRPVLVSIGDSFTLGYGVALAQTGMSRFMTDYQTRRAGSTPAHAMLATVNWNPVDYYFAYLTEVRPVRPSVVVVGFYAGNDLLHPAVPTGQRPSTVPPDTKPPGPTVPPRWRSLELARVSLSSSPLVARLGIGLGMRPSQLRRFDPNEDQSQLWARSLDYIRALVVAAREDQVPVVLISYPSAVQVEAGHALAGGGYDADLPDRVLGRFCGEERVSCIFLLDALRARRSVEGPLYFRKDRHLNERGHGVVFEVLQKALTPILDEASQPRRQP